MDPTTRLLMQGAAGAGKKVYVEDVFSTWLYTGNGSTQTITNGIDLSGKGGLVWVKGRSAGSDHGLVDTVRGISSVLNSNTTSAALTSTSTQDITAFTSSGFSLGTSGQFSSNSLNITYASWSFREAEKFFDVVTYVGNGSSPRQITHNLGSVPGCIIAKGTSTATDWPVYHRGLNGGTNPEQWYLTLNSSAAQTNAVANWGNTAPTSTTFTVGANNNINGVSYVAYLFAHNAGGFGDSGNDNIVSCGSYTGTGTPGLAVTLGFEPQWVLVKNASSGVYVGWFMFDTMRGMAVGESDLYLYAMSSGAELGGGSDYINPTATGFTLTNSSQVINESGNTFIYVAIRRGLMKTPTDATKVFSMVNRAGTGATATVSGFTNLIDALIVRGKVNGFPANFYDRLRGATKILFSSSTSSEVIDANTLTGFDVQTGYTVGSDNSGYGINYALGGVSYINWGFRRAPGFFDVVAYTGTGSARTVSHNLGVAPELMIVKERNNVGGWDTYTAALGSTKVLYLHDPGGEGTSSGAWNNTSPTAAVFTVGINNSSSSYTYIAYLFATCPGVSKVGSYTGTGTTQQINCGFTSGSRFVLIKRTDATGDWYVWDSARGIVPGNDPYLLLNTSDAEVTGTDYVDTFSSGFEISSTAPAAINGSGGSFIFLAIA